VGDTIKMNVNGLPPQKPELQVGDTIKMDLNGLPPLPQTPDVSDSGKVRTTYKPKIKEPTTSLKEEVGVEGHTQSRKDTRTVLDDLRKGQKAKTEVETVSNNKGVKPPGGLH
jgi:hypothetical protein